MLRKSLMGCFCVVLQITAVFCQLPSTSPPPIFTLSTNSSSSSSSYCPATQRYDVNTFPPRCFDLPRVFPNRMQVARITTTLISTARRPAPKFSPGLPQNQTCGGWTAPANQTFDIVSTHRGWSQASPSAARAPDGCASSTSKRRTTTAPFFHGGFYHDNAPVFVSQHVLPGGAFHIPRARALLSNKFNLFLLFLPTALCFASLLLSTM